VHIHTLADLASLSCSWSRQCPPRHRWGWYRAGRAQSMLVQPILGFAGRYKGPRLAGARRNQTIRFNRVVCKIWEIEKGEQSESRRRGRGWRCWMHKRRGGCGWERRDTGHLALSSCFLLEIAPSPDFPDSEWSFRTLTGLEWSQNFASSLSLHIFIDHENL